MLGKVIKPFAFAADGYTVSLLNEGDERDFGSAAEGLRDEGFILTEGDTVAEPEAESEAEPEAETETETEPEAGPEANEAAEEVPAEEKPARRTRKS